ncbi:hypothetical protein HK405_010188, partial [Cladochytrium tenue]
LPTNKPTFWHLPPLTSPTSASHHYSHAFTTWATRQNPLAVDAAATPVVLAVAVEPPAAAAAAAAAAAPIGPRRPGSGIAALIDTSATAVAASAPTPTVARRRGAAAAAVIADPAPPLHSAITHRCA